MQIFNFLASTVSVFESGFVGNPEDRFSHNEAHIWLYEKIYHFNTLWGAQWLRGNAWLEIER